MKKIVLFLILAGYIVSLTACDFGEPEDKTEDSSNETEESSDAPSTKKTEPTITNGGDFGDARIVVKGAKLSKDYKDQPCVVITYTYTNNGDESQSFMFAASSKVFQSGIELDSGFSVDGVDSGLLMSEIKKGVTIDVSQGYVLKDESELEIDLDVLISFDDSKKVTIKIPYSDITK